MLLNTNITYSVKFSLCDQVVNLQSAALSSEIRYPLSRRGINGL